MRAKGGSIGCLRTSPTLAAARNATRAAAGTYIGLGFSLCTLVGGQLSPDLREQQPGLFNLLFGIYGFPWCDPTRR